MIGCYAEFSHEASIEAILIDMKRFRLNIISIIILLFSWSIFASPSLSASLDNSSHHEIAMQLMPCHDDNCLIQLSTSCAQHCDALSVISAPSFRQEFSPPHSPKLFADDQTILQFYTMVELKPPIR